MIEYHFLKDRAVALLLWNADKENDAHVYLGEIIMRDGGFHFVNIEKKWDVLLNAQQLERLKEVPEHLKEIFLNADFSFSLSMSGIPEDLKETFISTGMKWHLD